MNNSEKLLSAFSEMYFFKELVFDDLCFTPKGKTEIELADLIINLEDKILAIQLKSRKASEQTNEYDKEKKWLERVAKAAKKQVKESLKYLQSGSLPGFQNKRGQTIEFDKSADIIPLVVFDNSFIKDYPHILKKHSDSGQTINCISFIDFQEMCQVLLTPFEVFSYLKYRKDIYEKNGEIDISIFQGQNNEVLITKPTKNESLVFQFLTYRYGYIESRKAEKELKLFQLFLRQLPIHTVAESQKNASYTLILFFAHMERDEISCFIDYLEDTKIEAKQKKSKIIHSLRNTAKKYAIVFVTNDFFDMNDLTEIVLKTAIVKTLLQVLIYREDKNNYRVDFLYREI